jgi:hypothetical protein
MDRKFKIVIPVVAGVLALSTGIGTVAVKAASQNEVGQPSAAAYQTTSQDDTLEETDPWYCGGYGAMMGYGAGFPVTPRVADLLGTTVADLQAQLDSGKTLADIAGEKGISQDQLIQTITALYRDHLALMVKYGYLNQEAANGLTQQAQERAQTMITSQLNGETDCHDYMGSMMGEYAGGMMYSRGGRLGSSQQPDNIPAPGPQNGYNGYGEMMGGYGGGYNGGMMGGYSGGMMGRR